MANAKAIDLEISTTDYVNVGDKAALELTSGDWRSKWETLKELI